MTSSPHHIIPTHPTTPSKPAYALYAVYKRNDMNVVNRIKNRGRYAGPTQRVATPIGTRSEIFQFNELDEARDLNILDYNAEGVAAAHLEKR